MASMKTSINPSTANPPTKTMLKLVGAASDLPDPFRIFVDGPGAIFVRVVTREQWYRLGPQDDPDSFRSIPSSNPELLIRVDD
jgi:hypothetical protein